MCQPIQNTDINQFKSHTCSSHPKEPQILLRSHPTPACLQQHKIGAICRSSDGVTDTECQLSQQRPTSTCCLQHLARNNQRHTCIVGVLFYVMVGRRRGLLLQGRQMLERAVRAEQTTWRRCKEEVGESHGGYY